MKEKRQTGRVFVDDREISALIFEEADRINELPDTAESVGTNPIEIITPASWREGVRTQNLWSENKTALWRHDEEFYIEAPDGVFHVPRDTVAKFWVI